MEDGPGPQRPGIGKQFLMALLNGGTPVLDKPGPRDSPRFTALFFSIPGTLCAGMAAFSASRHVVVGIAAGLAGGAIAFWAGWWFERRAEERGRY